LDFLERLGHARAEPESAEVSPYPASARMLQLGESKRPFVLIVDEVERIHAVKRSELQLLASQDGEERSFLSTMWLNEGHMIPLIETNKLLAAGDWARLPKSVNIETQPRA
jgi:chemotaxis signal transduction protein